MRREKANLFPCAECAKLRKKDRETGMKNSLWITLALVLAAAAALIAHTVKKHKKQAEAAETGGEDA